MPIQTSDGNQVLLKEVADIRMTASQTVIRHDAMSAYVDVGFTVQGREASIVTVHIQAKMKGYAFPFEYHAEVLSNTAVLQASQQRLLVTGLIALIGIFLLLQASARSWRMAFATLLVLPASLAGGVVAASLTNSSLSVAALFGLLPILGIAARNSLMLISHYQHIEIEEGKPFGRELVLRGSRRAGCTDLDDRADNRSGCFALRGHRQPPWSGDRLPHGKSLSWVDLSLRRSSICLRCLLCTCVLAPVVKLNSGSSAWTSQPWQLTTNNFIND